REGTEAIEGGGGRVASDVADSETVASDSESLLGDNATCPLSFDPSTRVLMADGSTKPIADVKVGDRVATAATTAGVITANASAGGSVPGAPPAEPVTGLHDNSDTDMADVTVATGDGRTAVIQTTQHHLFWSDTAGGWVPARNLRTGDRLHTA